LILLTLVVCAFLTTQTIAQIYTESDEAKTRLNWFEQHQEMLADSPFNDISWQFVGPQRMTGRLTDVAVHPSQPDTIYIASASGGAFKSTDDGKTWTPIFENYPTASLGDITIAPSNPRIVWIGTGEANIFRSSMAGTGIYKSNNGGQTFQYMGLADTQHIARIIVHPKNPNIVYVAACGHEYTPNQERGVYKTTDGGRTWNQVFYKDSTTAAIDLVMDPVDNDTLYLGTAERLRKRWNDPVAGPQSGIWKTEDGGERWFPLTNGLPDFANCERIGLDVCLEQPNIVYALINNHNPRQPDPQAAARAGRGGRGGGARGGRVTGADLYRSDDYGNNWERCPGSPQISGIYSSYGWVFGQVRVDPVDADVAYVHGVSYMKTSDGGHTFQRMGGSHADYHAMWINPENTDHILVGNDGGLMISHDGLESYEHPINLPLAQMYNVSVSQEEGKFMAYTCIQDNMGWRGEIDLTGGRNNIIRQEWQSGYGDESGRHAVNPTNPNIVWAVSRYGGGPTRNDYTPIPGETGRRRRGGGGGSGPDFGDDRKRAQWVSPIIISPHDDKRVFYGAQFVFLTDDDGATWQKISPDLTNFDPVKQGNIAYSTVFAIDESPVKKGLIYAGTDDGLIQVTNDEGKTWTNVSADLPPDHCIAGIDASAFDEGTVYAAINGKRVNNFNCLIYKSTDYGQTWTNIANNIPGSIVNVVKEDATNKNILYAGTDRAVYVTIDGGDTWNVLGKDLPTVFAQDIAFNEVEQVAVIATHGCGAFLIDLIPVRNAAK